MQRRSATLSHVVAALALHVILLACAASACSTGTYVEVTSLGGTPPSNINGHTLSAYAGNGRLYVFGGMARNYTSGADTYYGALSAFDTSAQTWSTLSASGGPTPRAYHGSAVSTAGGTPKLLVAGGYHTTSSSQTLYNHLWSWNIQAGGWTQLASAPISVYSPGFVYHNGNAYLFGGVYNAFSWLTNALYKYNVASNTWTTLTARGAVGSPSPRFGARAFIAGGNLYIQGGMQWLAGASAPTPVPLGDTWMFNMATNAWTNVTPTGSGSNISPATAYAAATSAATASGSVVLVGGDTGAGVGGLTGCGAPYPQQVSDDTWVGTISGTTVSYAKQTPATRPPAMTQAAGDSLGACFYLFGGFGFPSCPPGQVWNNKLYAYGI
jgi:N-acetylneuraminic acid mutarotase